MTALPLSLYLDLESGEKADLETVARASLAFAATIRDVGFVLDPSIEIRIELASGTEGSLSLNAIVKSLNDKIHDPKYLASVVLGVAAYFGTEFMDWAVHRSFDMLAGEPPITLSDQDAEKVAEATARILEKKIGSQHAKQVYRELETDPAIKGVGTTTQPGTRPATIVPRAEFRQRSELVPATKDQIGAKRTVTKTGTFALIKPVLKRGTRHWRFSGDEGEFGATMEDTAFVENVLSGNVAMPMVEGLQFRLTLNVSQEYTAERVWQNVGYAVATVHSFKRPPIQETLGYDSLPLPELRASEKEADEDE